MCGWLEARWVRRVGSMRSLLRPRLQGFFMCRVALLVGATDGRQVAVAGLSVVVAAPRSSAVISVGWVP